MAAVVGETGRTHRDDQRGVGLLQPPLQPQEVLVPPPHRKLAGVELPTGRLRRKPRTGDAGRARGRLDPEGSGLTSSLRGAGKHSRARQAQRAANPTLGFETRTGGLGESPPPSPTQPPREPAPRTEADTRASPLGSGCPVGGDRTQPRNNASPNMLPPTVWLKRAFGLRTFQHLTGWFHPLFQTCH